MGLDNSNVICWAFSDVFCSTNHSCSLHSSLAVGLPSSKFAASRYFAKVVMTLTLAPAKSSNCKQYADIAPWMPPMLLARVKVGVLALPSERISSPVTDKACGANSWPRKMILPSFLSWLCPWKRKMPAPSFVASSSNKVMTPSTDNFWKSAVKLIFAPQVLITLGFR